jgi:hypothetical protein
MTVQRDVSTAYQALVAEMAACGQQIAECVRGTQGDAAALAGCRDQREACVMAGAPEVNAIAAAARACTEAQRECVSSSDDRMACSAELRACLGVPDSAPDQGAAGSPGGETGAAVRDCVAELHTCLEGDGEPQTCAQQVHTCVADALPSAAALMPGMPEDPGMAGDHVPEDPGMAGDHMPEDPGAPEDPGMAGDHMPEDPGMPADPGSAGGMPEDVPAGGGRPEGLPEPAQAAVMCLEAFMDCAESDAPPSDCVEALRACTAERRP